MSLALQKKMEELEKRLAALEGLEIEDRLAEIEARDPALTRPDEELRNVPRPPILDENRVTASGQVRGRATSRKKTGGRRVRDGGSGDA